MFDLDPWGRRAQPLDLVYTFSQEPLQVYEAFTSGVLIPRWWVSAEGWRCKRARVLPAVGGGLSLEFRNRRRQLERAHGLFIELDQGQRLVFSWHTSYSMASHVEIVLRAAPGGTQLHLVHDFLPTRYWYERYRSCWTQSLDRLQRLLSKPARSTLLAFPSRY